ncbi:MAG: peptidoglycan DD-metalloendopeptidase family protein [Acidobacteriota bacterium]|nr:peptidoglycan DD-metalloendopeptidase family protein [Acidobacteriota bacterium]
MNEIGRAFGKTTGIFLALAVACVLTKSAWAQAPVPRPDVSDFEKRLAKINAQINDAKSKINEAKKKESGILATLANLELTKKLLRSELASCNIQLEKTNIELASMRSDINRLKDCLEKERQSIEKTLVTLYKFGRLDFLQFMLRADNIDSVFAENKHLALLAQYQEKVISGFQETLAELTAVEARLESKKSEISGIIRAAREKEIELEAEERANRDFVREVQRNRKTHEATLNELKESAGQLQILIKKIINQEWTLPYPFVPLYDIKGKLPWPLRGRIITRFGLQKHPHFNTTTLNNGIEIAPQKNASIIQAIHAGKVVYADYFEGYGNLLIVDHGMTYYSLYGHCSEFMVSPGDIIKAEQPIALVGDSGSLKGRCLYFEIRFKTKALDPLKWLNRR